jgi:hypothetical protein
MTREPMPPETWAFVVHRDRVCQASAFGFGSTAPCAGALQVHHRLPRGRGGTHDPELLVTLCLVHHAEAESYRTRAYDCGLLLRTGTT